MGESICPSLYRDEQGRFYCMYARREIDPGVMPCLGTYWECPIYVDAQERGLKLPGEEVEEAPEPLAVEEGVEEPAAVPQPVAVVEEKREYEEELIERLQSLEQEIIDLSRAWEEYEQSARRLLEEWRDVGEDAKEILSGIERSMESYKRELEELEVRRKLRLVPDDVYQDVKQEIETTLKKYVDLRENIRALLNNIERLVLPHYKRVKAAEAKPDIAKFRLSLMKLEQMHKEGRIGENVYNRLRAEIEAEIKRLERLVEEVA